MSVLHPSNLPLYEPSLRTGLVAFEHDDACPIPPEYRNSPPSTGRWMFTREGRATLAYRQLLEAGEILESSNRAGSATTLVQDGYSANSLVGNAKLLALQRFVVSETFSTYDASANNPGHWRGQGDLMFLPYEMPGLGPFVTKQELRTDAAIHRFSCKCGLANTPFLELWQSAFCDGPEGEYETSAAYAWYTVHEMRQDVYGTKGVEAPEWDPFPDGRGIIPRLESERENNEQRRVRETRWSATRRTERVLPEEALRPESWLPACRVPSGPAFSDRGSWTLEQEQKWQETVVQEEQQRRARKGILTAEAERREQMGVERLAAIVNGVIVPNQRLEAGGSIGEPAAGSSAATSGSSSRSVGRSSQTSHMTLGMSLALNAGYERSGIQNDVPERGERWWVAPARGRRPLQIVDPAARLDTAAVANTTAACDEPDQPPAAADEERAEGSCPNS